MNDQYNEKLIGNAKSLRKGMTPQERHLWYDFLKGLPVTVHRQKVMGPYIADFYIASKQLIIEIDGSQHYEEENQKKDEMRDAYFATIGYKVLRYSNADVNLRFRQVCEDIYQHVMGEG
jgi:very-short-patch-repair endonuclease